MNCSRGYELPTKAVSIFTLTTRTPCEMTESNVVALRDVGFTERDILDICTVAAYYAYVNRIADGLGVQMETWLLDD